MQIFERWGLRLQTPVPPTAGGFAQNPQTHWPPAAWGSAPKPPTHSPPPLRISGYAPGFNAASFFFVSPKFMICVRHTYRNIARDRNYNYNLFTNFPWPGNSEGTFRSLSHAATCPPVYPTRRRLHTPLYFYNVWFDPTGNRTRVYRFSSRCSIHSTSDRFKSK